MTFETDKHPVEIVAETDDVTITYEGTVTIKSHASGRAARNWPDSDRVYENVDQYRVEWDFDSDPGSIVDTPHGRGIGCPDCKTNTRAVFRGYPDNPHYECLVCGYTNEFDPEELHRMRRSAFGEVVDE